MALGLIYVPGEKNVLLYFSPVKTEWTLNRLYLENMVYLIFVPLNAVSPEIPDNINVFW